ncbi:MAG: ABC transporter ATP-binding protein [Deltaproteobacteria bacterium HGW-Deltaproteobacteria-12]|jgi:ATP-binding cassette subfamily F protein uup|nr:MAG: ABC transporter ATP-binding protein [Deltaproteobacteria bacterium HGW-Deltaproteobacteria-12]
MGLIWVNNISVSFGGPLLLSSATLQIEAGERIGLLGRNGSGKSTLLKCLSGNIVPDAGEIVKSDAVIVSLLPQEVPDDLPGTVYDIVAAGGRKYLDLLRSYHDLTIQMSHNGSNVPLDKLAGVQHQLESAGAWNYHLQVESILSRTGLNENAEFRNLSAGMKRRVFMARALASEPDLLLLDEPTNHLDIDAILWLEDFLLNYSKAIMFVTHDRAFLQKLATSIVEIDRGKLISFACNYRIYLQRRQALLESEEKQWQNFDKKLAKEEVWIRQGVKARRTRNEGRVTALLRMRQERALRRKQTGLARLNISEAQRGGRIIVEAENISFAYDNIKIINGFSNVIIRGDKVGIIGPNGVGKTTLLKILLGELAPQQGRIRLGTEIKIAYFDQLRAQLDETRTLRDNIASGSDTVFLDGSPRHIVGYLQDFLFPPEQIMSKVMSLSGGERNRLLLAKLFSIPSNVLVLDEPTNDLDAETLELLEERLLEYKGTILMVSHDRAFLNNVVTSTIVFEGEGQLGEYVGGYDDWLMQLNAQAKSERVLLKEEKPKKEKMTAEKRKLTFKEARELQELPQKIAGLEAEKQQLAAILNSPAFYASRDAAKISMASERLAILDCELETAYNRWYELEDMAAQLG